MTMSGNNILALLPQSHTHVTTLLQILIHTYFARLSSVLIIHDANNSGSGHILQEEYLSAVQRAFRNLSQHGRVIGLQWIDVGQLDARAEANVGEDADEQLEQQLLRAVDIVTEGFITILSDTSRFLHARYYATRNSRLRLKDKLYLFLCMHESPHELLSTEILQFYPHHLMVLPETTTPTHYETTTNAIRKLWPIFRNVANNTQYTAHRDINFQLWTQNFNGAAENLNASLLDAFLPNATFQRNVELYPNKVWNLKGRAMRVGSITYIPYVVTNYVAAGAGNVDPIDSDAAQRTISYLGSEAELVKSFCQVRNCHLRVEPYGVDNWGYIYENESAAGMLGDIYLQRVELAIGCIYNWYNNITETSHTIARSAVTVLGPAPAQFPAWRTNILPFSTELWLFLIVTMLLCASVMYCIRFMANSLRKSHLKSGSGREFQHVAAFQLALLDIFAVFIQQPSAPTSLQTFAARFFLTTILCATITLENTYSGQLKSLLTIPLYSEAVDTIDKWSKTDWSWGAPSKVWVQTVENSNLIKEQIMTKKFQVRDYGFLYNASFRADYGLGVERLMSGSFSFGDFITVPALDTKIVPKDDLYFDWTRAVSIRGWPLMPLFNKHVLACMETGLFVHWERQYVARYLDRQTQEMMLNLASGHTSKAPPKKLTIEDISGATFALLFGCLFASIILALELFVQHLRKLRQLCVYCGLHVTSE